MENVDRALYSMQKIQKDFKIFCENNLYVTEADTRINLIDRILHEVLLWAPEETRREPRASNGYLDYLLSVNGKQFVCVEAKKEGIAFQFPKDKQRKFYTLNGAISKDKTSFDAITQVRSYCDDTAIRYAVATNGYTWIIFRAIREDFSWKEGSARVFHSLEDIINSFVEFWNLLSYPCICSGSLDGQFSSVSISNRDLTRVLNFLLQPDVPLLRNFLHTELHPIITHFFEDIADPDFIETLENCYVYSTTIKTVASDINYVIKDSVPKFLKDEGITEIIHKEKDAGTFGKVIEKAIKKDRGQLFLLLGGIGSGKTTFQKRYQLTVGKEVLNDFSIWFSIDFLKPPTVDKLEDFVWENILKQLRQRYQSPYLETRKNIKQAYDQEINSIKQTALYGLHEGSKEYESKLSVFLSKWQSNLSEYVPKLLVNLKPKKDLSVVLFFDNVDQLSPGYQAQIFLLAQRITDIVNSITIIALREESYYTASIQKVFTAYINRKFHIASPPFRKLIGQRIRYALKVIDEEASDLSKFEKIKQLHQKQNISAFLRIVENSIFEGNRNIAKFIDHLCFGNMRYALQMFSAFLVSGATDVDKMLRIYRREGNYYVAFHEFLRSIMLGERYYYKEAHSSILNIFECGQEKNSSHFTSLRILSLLDHFRTQTTKEGEGFYEITNIISDFEDIFNNKEDVIKSLNRLIFRQLIETNTKIYDSIIGSSHVRITSSGWYYLKFLTTSFAYLDLVFQDTPINNRLIIDKLVSSITRVNNLSDPEENKIPRMEERFSRVEIFLGYLNDEEQLERKVYFLDSKSYHNPIYFHFIPTFFEEFNKHKEWIMKRLKENKERFEEEINIMNFAYLSEMIEPDKDE